MKAILYTALAATIALPGVANAQAASSSPEQNPISTALKSSQKRAERNLVGSAESMPAGKYDFKPTPAQMSFGQLMLHVAGSNEFMCSTISGQKAPQREKLTPTAGKDKVVERLKQSFDYCTSALSNVDDSKLGETVPFFGGRSISRGGAMMGLAEDWADHYGAAAIYLRLNGILPPSARGRNAEGM
ncbi:MAG TPA: DinB family protein [Gemmatimonadaceae bacterium]